MTVDHRTRVDRPLPLVDPIALFEQELPAALARKAALVASTATWSSPGGHRPGRNRYGRQEASCDAD